MATGIGKTDYDEMIRMEINKKFLEPANRLAQLVSSKPPGWEATAMQELEMIRNGIGGLTELLKRTSEAGFGSELVYESNSGRRRRKRRRVMCTSDICVPVSKNDQGAEVTPHDGYIWRKYGQKDILGSSHPRMYFRCSHRDDSGCPATKIVQKMDSNPSSFQVNYNYTHKCKSQAGLSTNYTGSSIKFQPTSLNPKQEVSLMSITQRFKLQYDSEPENFCSPGFPDVDSLKTETLRPSQSTSCHSAPSVMFNDATDLLDNMVWDLSSQELISRYEFNLPIYYD